MTHKPQFNSYLPALACNTIILFLFVVFPVLGYAQFTPAEGSLLNYRIIGFSFPEKKETTRYIIEIASGTFNTEKEFTAHKIKAISSTENKIVGEVPSFDKAYTWRVICKRNDVVSEIRKFHHFTLGAITADSLSLKRLHINSVTQKVEDAYILVDGVSMIFDLKGEPVWYMPNDRSFSGFTDLKLSSSGTLTFLANTNSYEMGYNGNILWQTTGKQINTADRQNSFCHHEFNKLGNGNYMALISSPPDQKNRVTEGGSGRKKFFPLMLTSRLVEFNKNGDEVWSWESLDYIMQSDLQYLRQQYQGSDINLHENAFVFDEKNKVIYISMVGINRIVKIQYPGGKVLGEYGAIYHPVADSITYVPDEFPVLGRLLTNNMFYNQHSLQLSGDGCLYTCSSKKDSNGNFGEYYYPQILKMKQSGGALEKVWELDGRPLVSQLKNVAGGGGNVMVLPNNNIFVSFGSPYDNMVVVDANKNVLWSAMADFFDPVKKSWVPYSKYRASIITRAQLEQMVWSGKDNTKVQDVYSSLHP